MTIVELARAIQTTLDTLVVQVDEAIGAANAAVTVALERRDVDAAREALETSHDYSEYRERVIYARKGWIDLQLPPEDRTAARIERIARGQTA